MIPADQVAAYSFETERMADGALLAHKTIVVRKDPSAKLRSIGTEGGPPPDFRGHPHRSGGGPEDLLPLF